MIQLSENSLEPWACKKGFAWAGALTKKGFGGESDHFSLQPDFIRNKSVGSESAPSMPSPRSPPPTPSKLNDPAATLKLLKTVNFEHTAHTDAQLGILSPGEAKRVQEKQQRGAYGRGLRSQKHDNSKSFRPDSTASNFSAALSDSTFADWKEDPFFSEVLDSVEDEEYSKKMEDDEVGEPLGFPPTPLGYSGGGADDDLVSRASTINPPAVAAPQHQQAPPPPLELTEEQANKTLKSQVARRRADLRKDRSQRLTKTQTLSLLQFAAGPGTDPAAQLPTASTKAFHSRKLGR